MARVGAHRLLGCETHLPGSGDSSRALHEIEAEKVDYSFELPRDAGPKLLAVYGPGSEAAKRGHQQYFISEANAVRYLHMNTSRPLFSQARLRRAVNYAIDRPALVAQARRFAEVNPFNAGRATDDILPPSIVGAIDFHVYPITGPMSRGRRKSPAAPCDGDHVYTQCSALDPRGPDHPS